MYSRSFIVVAVYSYLVAFTPVFADEPAAAPLLKPQSVVFFWNGDKISTLHPNANIADVASRYQLRGMRVVQAIGLPPAFFRQFVQQDRKAHPEDYEGKQVTLVMHGHGARFIPKILEIKKELATMHAGAMPAEPATSPAAMATPAALDRVKDEEIILAFIEGIGAGAKAEAINSACFFGQNCLAVNLLDTPFADRVSRLIVPRRIAGASLSDLIPVPTAESVLSRLSEILVPPVKQRE